MELVAEEEPPHILVKQGPEADIIPWSVPNVPFLLAGPEYQRFHNSPQTALAARTQVIKNTSLWGIISDLTHNRTLEGSVAGFQTSPLAMPMLQVLGTAKMNFSQLQLFVRITWEHFFNVVTQVLMNTLDHSRLCEAIQNKGFLDTPGLVWVAAIV